jgi:hypothetical protein
VKRGTLCTPRSDDLIDSNFGAIYISVRSDASLGHPGAKTENTKSAKTPEWLDQLQIFIMASSKDT